ncbi:MAG: porin, partial [Planctomycetota bacterium]
EIEGMIADVFADANSRATLLQEGALAGIDEKGKIFLLSSDGSFSANFNGQFQVRYIFNNQEDRTGTPSGENISGMQIRRVKFGAKGKVGDGWGYELKFATDRDGGSGGGSTVTEDAVITYKFNDSWSMQAGVKKLPFARQELISSSRQVGVDRTLVTEFFTLNRSDHVAFKYGEGDIKAVVALSDGGNADFIDFNDTAGANDFAITARVDWQAIGDDWGAAKHEFGGVDEDALFVGGALHYEVTNGGTAHENGLAWTVDALYKTGPLGLTAAVFGNHTEAVAGADTDQFGVYVQGSMDLGNDWDIFARWEHIDDDDAGGVTEDLQAITFGANHHFNKNVKLTGDVVWIYAGDNPSADGDFINGGELSDGLGLSSSLTDDEDQIAFRLQLQLVF